MSDLIKGFRNKDGEILSIDYSTISIERDADNNPVTDLILEPEDIGAASKKYVEEEINAIIEYINESISQKSPVQIITWEADD